MNFKAEEQHRTFPKLEAVLVDKSTHDVSPKESTTATSVDEPTTPSTEMSTPTVDSI